MTSLRPFVRPVLSFLLLGACQVPPGETVGDIPGDDDGDDSTGEIDDGPPTTGSNDTNDAPPDPVYDCEPADPSACPMGQKCSALSDGGAQNHYQCVADDGELLPYDPCIPAPGNGQDGCGGGTVCLGYGEDDLGSGRCFRGCRNDADCEPGVCVTSPYSGTTYCAENCDPLVGQCPPGLGCRQTEDRFACEMTLSDDVGGAGDPCFGFRGCANTLACMPGELVPGCSSSACCTATCTTDGPADQCAAPAICASMFNEPAPEFELIGACFVPA